MGSGMGSDETGLTAVSPDRRRYAVKAYTAVLIGLAVLTFAVAFLGQQTVLAVSPEWLATSIRPAVGENLFVAMLVGVWQFLGLGAVGFGLATLWTWVRLRWSDVRHVADVERGAPVELVGTARPVTTTVTAPLTGAECLAHGYEVAVHRPDRDGSSDWHTVDVGVASTPFRLEDATGSVVVDPAGADFHVTPSTAAEAVDRGADEIPEGVVELARLADVDLDDGIGTALPPALSGDRYRFIERFRIEPGETVYVSGVATGDGTGLSIEEPQGVAARARRSLSAPFIVSDASEGRLERSLLRSAAGTTALGVLMVVTGAWAFVTLI